MKGKINFRFSAITWQYASPGGWFFVSLPLQVTKEIRENMKWMEEGWGRLKVIAKVDASTWETAIWFDTKHRTYILPLKAEIRKREKIEANQRINVVVYI
jgi:hypothetical protein